MQTMAWLPCLTPDGYRVPLTPWLVCLIEWACRQMSIKTVGMVCHPYQAAWKLSTAEYRKRVMGEGPTYMDRLKGQVACGECGELLAAGYLSSNMMTQHGRAAEIRRQ